jgi:hypothetical protein
MHDIKYFFSIKKKLDNLEDKLSKILSKIIIFQRDT